MTRQQFFPGTEPPDVVQVGAIDDAICDWHGAQRAQREAADAVKIKHAKILELLDEQQIERYPYIDEKTGKKRQIRIKLGERKAVSERAAREQHPEADTRVIEDWSEEKQTPLKSDSPPTDNVVEMRRVKRTAAHDAVIDPFASTRAAMGDETPPGRDWTPDEGAQPGDGVAEPPKRRKGKAK